MLKVGITGGIGSGKSMVCQVFATLGIPVFNADDAARHLMEHDAALAAAIANLLGAQVYENGRLVREKVSATIFREPALLQQLNALVHPATIAYAHRWMQEQASPYIIKEAAIFFESGSYTEMDIMVGVYAPADTRISRVVRRGNTTREKVLDIMARQMSEEEKMNRCDYVITNDDHTAILPQVLHLHEILMSKSL